ncbi:S24 family peptidase [uncultured Ruminococcus sp.]|uniref:LexA family protein n=1 Tax=uncultured Ruminococcus sp. TaxID=165186 RepID=UPI0025EC5AD0|nr:S24 family peptidase [uncultured Ruminococcus sp.]
MTVGEKIREARLKKGYTQTELAELLGYKSRSSINKIEVEGRDIPRSSVIKFAKALDVTPAYLMGWEEETTEQSLYDRFDNLHPVKLKRFPLLGEIACGEPIYAEEEHESYVSADADIRADFCLKAKGDSMINADIHDGDVVFIRSQSMVENGEIAAVIIEDEATLKRVYYDRENNRLQLIAENPRYTPLVYTGEELNYIRILGKAVTLMREL